MGTTVFANFASAFGISAAGFTTSGVGAGTFAAGVQSGIGIVKAGTAFTYFQSLGALGQGILGASVLPVTLAVGATAGSGYLLH